MASVHASEATLGRHEGHSSLHRAVIHPATMHVALAVCCIPAQASAKLTRFVLNGSFGGMAKHIEPEPAPEDPVEWAMASDDEDDAPMSDAPPEPTPDAPP